MVTTNDITELNIELFEIWSSYNGKITDKNGKAISPFLSPCYLSETFAIETCKLLIIGINPSYSYKNWEIVINQINPDENNLPEGLRALHEGLNIPNISVQDKHNLIDDYCTFTIDNNIIDDITWLDRLAADEEEGVQYFVKMHELANMLNLGTDQWRHIDIFYYRETNQNKVKELMKHNEPFFDAQRDLTLKIIKQLKPSTILVSNAFAGSNFKRMFSDDDRSFINQYPICESKGTHLMKIGAKENVPVFFSGMLSGQRALDLGSYERLKWHMKAVADGKSMI